MSRRRSQRMKKLYTALGVLTAVSVGVNYWWFVIRPKSYEAEVAERARKEVALDPLLTPGVQHDGALGVEKDDEEPSGTTARRWLHTASASPDESSNSSREWRIRPDWQAKVSGKKMGGKIDLFVSGNRINKIKMHIETVPPKELTPEDIIRGEKSIWLTSVEGEVFNRDGLPLAAADSKAGSEPIRTTFEGKVKSYVTYDQQRVRTVSDVTMTLEKVPGSAEVNGTFEITRLESDRLKQESLFVVDAGNKEFAIYLKGTFTAHPFSEESSTSEQQ